VSPLGFVRRRRDAAADVAVVGSGLPALAVAVELAGRGRRVAVVGAGASRGLGLALLGPSRPFDRVAATLGREEARVLWSAGRENLGRLRSFLEALGHSCGFEERGSFLLAADRKEAEWLAESEDRLRDDGFSGEFLDHYMLETRFDLSGFAAAYWAAEGAEVDATTLGRALGEVARRKGALFHRGAVRGLDVGPQLVGVETEDGTIRAAQAVLATDGTASERLPELRALLQPALGGRLRVVPVTGASLPAAARTADGHVAWHLTPSGLTLAATGPAPGDGGGDGSDRLEPLAARLHGRPGSAHRWKEEGEVASDGLPIVGVLAPGSVAVAVGFGATVPSFAFVAGRWIADALLSGRDPTPRVLRPGRSGAPGASGAPPV
jgi:glycine/D-amino acid oxidase-like deaminating enzyme